MAQKQDLGWLAGWMAGLRARASNPHHTAGTEELNFVRPGVRSVPSSTCPLAHARAHDACLESNFERSQQVRGGRRKRLPMRYAVLHSVQY